MSDTLSFSDAIKASGSTARTILLGNGFSIAQAGGQFAYASLLEKSALADDSPIRNVFQVLNSFDFEIVMKALEATAQIELAYGDKDRSDKFKEDAAPVREALIHAIRAVHPGIQFDIPKVQRDACSVFLKHFESIFTLSYDLLLYWVILHAATKEFKTVSVLARRSAAFANSIPVGIATHTICMEHCIYLLTQNSIR